MAIVAMAENEVEVEYIYTGTQETQYFSTVAAAAADINAKTDDTIKKAVLTVLQDTGEGDNRVTFTKSDGATFSLMIDGVNRKVLPMLNIDGFDATIDEATINAKNNDDDYAVHVKSGIVNIANCTITSEYIGVRAEEGTQVTIDATTMTTQSYGVQVLGPGRITLQGNSVIESYSNVVRLDGGNAELTINGGTFTSTNMDVIYDGSGDDNSITINGGTINGGSSPSLHWIYSRGTMCIHGGNFIYNTGKGGGIDLTNSSQTFYGEKTIFGNGKAPFIDENHKYYLIPGADAKIIEGTSIYVGDCTKHIYIGDDLDAGQTKAACSYCGNDLYHTAFVTVSEGANIRKYYTNDLDAVLDYPTLYADDVDTKIALIGDASAVTEAHNLIKTDDTYTFSTLTETSSDLETYGKISFSGVCQFGGSVTVDKARLYATNDNYDDIQNIIRFKSTSSVTMVDGVLYGFDLASDIDQSKVNITGGYIGDYGLYGVAAEHLTLGYITPDGYCLYNDTKHIDDAYNTTLYKGNSGLLKAGVCDHCNGEYTAETCIYCRYQQSCYMTYEDGPTTYYATLYDALNKAKSLGVKATVTLTGDHTMHKTFICESGCDVIVDGGGHVLDSTYPTPWCAGIALYGGKIKFQNGVFAMAVNGEGRSTAVSEMLPDGDVLCYNLDEDDESEVYDIDEDLSKYIYPAHRSKIFADGNILMRPFAIKSESELGLTHDFAPTDEAAPMKTHHWLQADGTTVDQELPRPGYIVRSESGCEYCGTSNVVVKDGLRYILSNNTATTEKRPWKNTAYIYGPDGDCAEEYRLKHRVTFDGIDYAVTAIHNKAFKDQKNLKRILLCGYNFEPDDATASTASLASLPAAGGSVITEGEGESLVESFAHGDVFVGEQSFMGDESLIEVVPGGNASMSGDAIGELGEYSFNHANLQSLDFSQPGFNELPSHAFASQNNLRYVDLNNSVGNGGIENLELSAFANNENVTIHISESLVYNNISIDFDDDGSDDTAAAERLKEQLNAQVEFMRIQQVGEAIGIGAASGFPGWVWVFAGATATIVTGAFVGTLISAYATSDDVHVDPITPEDATGVVSGNFIYNIKGATSSATLVDVTSAGKDVTDQLVVPNQFDIVSNYKVYDLDSEGHKTETVLKEFKVGDVVKVTSIAGDAFANKGLSASSMKVNAEAITETPVLKGNTSITSFDYDGAAPITKIAANAFQNTGIKKLNIPAKITAIGDYAYADCAIDTVTVNWSSAVEASKNVFSDHAYSYAKLFTPSGASGYNKTPWVYFTAKPVAQAEYTDGTTADLWIHDNTLTIDNTTTLKKFTCSTKNEEVKAIEYNKDWKSATWQGLLMPCSFTVTDDILSKFSIAELWDTQVSSNGTIVGLEFCRLATGDQVKANQPYLVQPLTADAGTLNVATDAIEVTTPVTDYNCWTTKQKFSFCGTYEQKKLSDIDHTNKVIYVMSGGKMMKLSSASTLMPFNFYMVVENRDASDASALSLESIDVDIIDATGISQVESGKWRMENGASARKVIVDGKLVIKKGDRTYNVIGQEK